MGLGLSTGFFLKINDSKNIQVDLRLVGKIIKIMYAYIFKNYY